MARFCQKRVRSPKGKGEGWELPSKGGNQAKKLPPSKAPIPKGGATQSRGPYRNKKEEERLAPVIRKHLYFAASKESCKHDVKKNTGVKIRP